jgi:hypothetical protein
LNVPQSYHMPIMILRLLCLIPASIGAYNNMMKASSRIEFDATGLFENKSTPLIHNVALLWVSILSHHLQYMDTDTYFIVYTCRLLELDFNNKYVEKMVTSLRTK